MKEPVLIATRFSSNKQAGGVSTEVQIEACNHYCDRNSYKIIAHHKVEGESAKASNTSRLIKLLEFCKEYEGKTKFLVVFRVNRFARDVTSHYYLKTELLKMGIVLRSATEPIDSTPSGQLLETILAGLAQFQNSVKKEHVLLAMRKRLEQGIWVWKCPTGYINKQNALGKATVPVVDENYGDVITHIFDKFSTGVVTKTDIVAELENQEIYNHKGEKVEFSVQLVHKILNNPFYAGKMYVKEWDEEFEGAHQPLTDQTTFNRCQKLMETTNDEEERLSFNQDIVLNDQLFCDYCGSRMTAAKCKGKTKSYNLYYCHNKNCTNPNKKSVHKEIFENEFYEYLKAIRPDRTKFKRFSDTVVDYYENEQQNREKNSRHIRKQIDALEEEKANLIALGRQGALDAEELKIEKDKIKKSIIELKLELDESHEEELQIELLLEYAETFFRTLHVFWLEASPRQKVLLQRIIFPNGIRYSYPCFSNSSPANVFKVIESLPVRQKTMVTEDLLISNSMVDEFVVFVKDLVEVFPDKTFVYATV